MGLTIDGTVVTKYKYFPDISDNPNKAKPITIPSGVTSLGNQAFWGCKNLVSVNFLGTIPGIDNPTVINRPLDTLGDLPLKYLAGGPGTYTRANGGEVWTKQ